ncbi:MAG: hypothetical protein JRE28_01990 [Deltaproteobacteria bacterium]|nr:hypothetical protein [Deltaproteobacteria bacterium]
MKEAREIRQLWAVIEEDLKIVDSIATKRGNHMNLTSEKVAAYFESGMPSSKIARNLNLLSGKLSSISVRLNTIAEIFSERHNYKIFKCYRDEYRSNIRVDDLKHKLIKNKDMYMHQMLRDNIGHLEPKRKSKKREVLYMARQKAIESFKMIEMKNSISKIVKKMRMELHSNKVI